MKIKMVCLSARVLLLCFSSFFITACAYNVDRHPKLSDDVIPTQTEGKSLFVFYDGTFNTKKSNTNVRKLFEKVRDNRKVHSDAIWIEGVGATSLYLTGNLFGGGMESRINAGFRFLSERYRLGDRIFIIGFSRGAHQARALAGMISYTGLLGKVPDDDRKFNSMVHTIIESTKDVEDATFEKNGFWSNWDPETTPPLAKSLFERFDYKMVRARVEFLGLWDNVPGSFFKEYDTGDHGIKLTDTDVVSGGCKEEPNRRKGDRYKLDSYPPIKKIVHAVAIEEKRSLFKSVLACKPISNRFTKVTQRWFPGAHSDVGGGYGSEDSLSLYALQWMISQLRAPDIAVGYAGINIQNLDEKEHSRLDPLALAHYSLGDAPANLGSHCQDRPLPVEERFLMHPHDKRLDAGEVRMRFSRWFGLGKPEFRSVPYPLKCSDI